MAYRALQIQVTTCAQGPRHDSRQTPRRALPWKRHTLRSRKHLKRGSPQPFSKAELTAQILKVPKEIQELSTNFPLHRDNFQVVLDSTSSVVFLRRQLWSCALCVTCPVGCVVTARQHCFHEQALRRPQQRTAPTDKACSKMKHTSHPDQTIDLWSWSSLAE